MTESGPVSVERLEDGAYWRIVLGGSKGNVIDRALIGSLRAVFLEAKDTPEVKAVCLCGEGRHFSYGASVAEHLPGRVEAMLPEFHELFHFMVSSRVILLAAVHGCCLGGALEIVSVCHRVFAAPDAKLGQPEIALGVFAPVASLLLADRVGRTNAEELCLTGRVVDADEALTMGLVDTVDDDPGAAALDYAREHLLPKSAASLRFAVSALRHGLESRLDQELAEIETMYLDGLMSTEDAVEGLRAFVDKRTPEWKGR